MSGRTICKLVLACQLFNFKPSVFGFRITPGDRARLERPRARGVERLCTAGEGAAVVDDGPRLRSPAPRDVALRRARRYEEFEVVCSDEAEHRRRVKTRTADIVGHELPTWQQVCQRECEPRGSTVVLDTAGRQMEASVSALRRELEGL